MTEAGKPNRLANEPSPYLRQHAHNPVDWWPWCDAAFAKARAEDKPVFLSIGYSTCHWCHVMAEESFEDAAVAAALNRDFIAVKVDKEERPDVDNVYMRVCQAMTGNGGWPTSIFMSGGQQPFFAGTYFPKAHFLTLLDAVAQAWQEQRPALLAQSGRVLAALSQERAAAPGAEADLIRQAIDHFQRTFDAKWGGFGNAPKFPMPHNLLFLLRTAPELAERTLTQMSRGGIFDQVGGGFCRYSTDRQWLAPHFEKMLYDNALLAMAYALAYELTQEARYAAVLRRILDYLNRELRHEAGGFYAAQDADVGGVEGRYYLFSQAEILALLGEEAGALFCRTFDITEKGNFEGLNIPNLLPEREAGPEALALLPQVEAYRRGRMALHTDTKILTGWNALAAAGFAMAGRALGEEAYVRQAEEALAVIQERLADGDRLYSGESQGRLLGPGFLDDYAYTVFALLQLYQATLDQACLDRAAALARAAVSRFGDESGGFFFSGPEHEQLPLRPKESYDNALPSGNSVMEENLSCLAFLSGDQALAQAAARQRAYMAGQAAAYPAAFGFFLYSLLPKKEIVCALADPTDLAGLRLRADWLFRLGDLADYPLVQGKTAYYVCSAGTCRPPVGSLAELD